MKTAMQRVVLAMALLVAFLAGVVGIRLYEYARFKGVAQAETQIVVEDRQPHYIDKRTTAELMNAKGQTIRIDLEIADTGETHAYGLMYRLDMPEKSGMVFVFDSPRPVAFWMRNTLIPLDMIFIRPNGTIAEIIENAQPHDETPQGTEIPVKAVIEVNGGSAAQWKLAIGDKVTFADDIL